MPAWIESESERIARAQAWRSLRSAERRQIIKDRLAFPRFGWPAIYPPEKDPLHAPQSVVVDAAAGFGI